MNVQGRFTKTDIELWDSSGNPQYKSCWPAIAWETHALIFVFNPEDDRQVDTALIFVFNPEDDRQVDTSCWPLFYLCYLWNTGLVTRVGMLVVQVGADDVQWWFARF